MAEELIQRELVNRVLDREAKELAEIPIREREYSVHREFVPNLEGK
jgi:hypothetical protein